MPLPLAPVRAQCSPCRTVQSRESRMTPLAEADGHVPQADDGGRQDAVGTSIGVFSILQVLRLVDEIQRNIVGECGVPDVVPRFGKFTIEDAVVVKCAQGGHHFA